MAFLEFYKKGQGSISRLLALVSGGLLIIWGGYALWVKLQGTSLIEVFSFQVPHVGLDINLTLIISVAVVLLGVSGLVWLLNRPRSVDLLVETESEMRKISWPSRQEAWNSSIVVVITVLVMMGLLFFYDVMLNKILSFLFV